MRSKKETRISRILWGFLNHGWISRKKAQDGLTAEIGSRPRGILTEDNGGNGDGGSLTFNREIDFPSPPRVSPPEMEMFTNVKSGGERREKRS